MNGLFLDAVSIEQEILRSPILPIALVIVAAVIVAAIVIRRKGKK